MLYAPKSPGRSPLERMPLHKRRKDEAADGLSPRSRFGSRDSVESLFEDMLQQVEQGVARMEQLEADVAAEREARARDAWGAAERYEALQRTSTRSLEAIEATQAALDDERATFAAERSALEACIAADHAAFDALHASTVWTATPRRSTGRLGGIASPDADADDDDEPVPRRDAPTPSARAAAAPPRMVARLEGKDGIPVVKHGRRGRPKATRLFFDRESMRLSWARVDRRRESAGGKPREISFGPDVDLEVARGRRTKTFARAKAVAAERCVSVVVAAHDVDESGRASLDLELATEAERDALADALEALAQPSASPAHRRWGALKACLQAYRHAAAS